MNSRINLCVKPHWIKFRRIIIHTSSQSVRIETIYETLVSSAKQKISYLEKSKKASDTNENEIVKSIRKILK